MFFFTGVGMRGAGWGDGGVVCPARAGLRIDVIDADKLIVYEDLAFFELWHRQVGLPLECFDPACLLDEDARHGLGNGRHCDGGVKEEEARDSRGRETGNDLAASSSEKTTAITEGKLGDVNKTSTQ
jgi:hypothetical protein